jgi:bifunctional NMN adenylyltransferase/nudix hydrolase
MSDRFDFLVCIGRFQPPHSGHVAVVRYALALSRRLILLCGSARQPRSMRNPWTAAEVANLFCLCLSDAELERVDIEPMLDMLYNDRLWVRGVQRAVAAVVARRGCDAARARIGLIGLSEGEANYYPSRFPQWGAVPFAQDNGVRATAIRAALFEPDEPQGQGGSTAYLSSAAAGAQLPEPVRRELVTFCTTDVFTALRTEATFLAKYWSAWDSVPYPPTFVTVDAIVVQSGHILLVERKARPGRGLLALPGGFVGSDEWLEDACIRELREETRLKVPVPVLKGSIRGRRVFDAPYRSQRGRTITHAFLIELAPAAALPRVKGGDDARHAFWLPLGRVEPEQLFEDHYFIIQAMLC